MRRLLALLVLIGALWCIAVQGGAPVRADPLPPCVDGQYGPGQAGTVCQVRGDTTPTARCWDGTFDYSESIDACAGHGGVFAWIQASPAVAPGVLPDAPTALCNDGTYSFSADRQGTCSYHQGVKTWINPPAS